MKDFSSKALIIAGCFLLILRETLAAPPAYTVENIPGGTGWTYPGQMFFNPNGAKLYVTDQTSKKVFTLMPDGTKTVFAGGGAQFNQVNVAPTSVYFSKVEGIWDNNEGTVFVADSYASRIHKVVDNKIFHFAGGASRGFAGNGGPTTSALINSITNICGDTAGNVYFNEEYSVRKVDNNGIVSVVAGTNVRSFGGVGGPATSAAFEVPYGVTVAGNGDVFFSSDHEFPGRIHRVAKADKIFTVLAGGGSQRPTLTGVPAVSCSISVADMYMDAKENIFFIEFGLGTVNLLAKQNNYQTVYLLKNGLPSVSGITGDYLTGKLFIAKSNTNEVFALTAPDYILSDSPTRAPTTAAPSNAPTLAVPEYSVTVSAKSLKYFEVRVFTGANERVFPVSYDLVDCPENAGAVVWGHESTPTTEDTNTCVYGLPRHYWCECPALVNGNKPKLTLNFGGTVFDRVELLILDWVDGEVTVSDSANNIVLFSASRAGGPLVGEEFVRYDHLNLLQIAPSVTPTIVPSSVPTTKPSHVPTIKPTAASVVPTQTPTMVPTTTVPSAEPSVVPSMVPSAAPSFTAQYTITLTAKTFKYFEVRVYTHDNLRIFPVSYELEHCPENAGVAVWNDQTTEDTNTCVYGYPRNFWCECSAVADEKPKLVLHMGHTVFDRVELLLLNWEDGEVTVTDEANHETFLSATHDGVGNEFVTFGNLNLEHAAPARKLLRGA